jgi:hypothetical protein
MDKKAASGVDNVTYQDYQKHFDENAEELIGRLKRQSYKARLVKRKHIPKSPGKTRPLGLPVLEDKLLGQTYSVQFTNKTFMTSAMAIDQSVEPDNAQMTSVSECNLVVSVMLLKPILKASSIISIMMYCLSL